MTNDPGMFLLKQTNVPGSKQTSSCQIEYLLLQTSIAKYQTQYGSSVGMLKVYCLKATFLSAVASFFVIAFMGAVVC